MRWYGAAALRLEVVDYSSPPAHRHRSAGQNARENAHDSRTEMMTVSTAMVLGNGRSTATYRSAAAAGDSQRNVQGSEGRDRRSLQNVTVRGRGNTNPFDRIDDALQCRWSKRPAMAMMSLPLAAFAIDNPFAHRRVLEHDDRADGRRNARPRMIDWCGESRVASDKSEQNHAIHRSRRRISLKMANHLRRPR